MPSPFPNPPVDQRGTTTTMQVHGRALEGNVWGDPTVRDVVVHTPAGFGADDALPAILVLPGFAGTGEGLLARGLTDVSLTSRLDTLIAAGCAPVRLVLPDVMTSVGGSQFVDSPGIGAYLTFLVEDVRTAVEGAFATTRWGATGRSSGGYGAFNLAAAAPDVFRAIAIHAGDAGFDLCYLGDLPKAVAGVRRAGGLDGFLDAFWAEHRQGSDLFAAMNILAMSCAYSPDPDARPFPARLPFDAEAGTLDLDVFRSWSIHDPIVRGATPEVREALGSLDLVFVDAGRRDEYLLHLGARRLVDTLRAGGVDVEHDEFDGGHRGTAWRYDVSLPKLAAALSG